MAKVDLAKRRRIMQRSQKLGHCVCEPRRPCPCDVFKDKGICPCAGERPEPVEMEQVKLTELVHNAGCASKIAAGDLEAVLARLPSVDDPNVLSGIPAGDDAGVYRLTDGVHLVQTVDVMTPCVDDPRMFGRICAANCLSDVYAMGATPRTALSILGFPTETFDGQIMYHMMAGAMEVLAEAGVALIGGHSIKDEEIKLGFAITGTIDSAAIQRGDAQVGDVLVLTKPLGAGVLNFSRQIGRVDAETMSAVEQSMATLNGPASEAMIEAGASACTDITGFGLFGHLIGMARQAGVTAEIWADVLPAFAGSVEAIRDGVVPGAIERNREHVGEDITVADGVEPALVELGFDAQTSGGLLIAVPAERHHQLLGALAARGVAPATIGKVTGESDGQIVVTLAGQASRAAPAAQAAAVAPKAAAAYEGADQPEPCCEPVDDAPCCAEADEVGQSTAVSTTLDAKKAYADLMRAALAAGEVDAKTKELIMFALVVMARCGPCIKMHLAKAAKMGITRQQLDEAAWLAVSIGGAPVWLYYQEALEVADGAEASGECCPEH